MKVLMVNKFLYPRGGAEDVYKRQVDKEDICWDFVYFIFP